MYLTHFLALVPSPPLKRTSPVEVNVTPKRKCIRKSDLANIRLPVPCPLPTVYTPAVQIAIQNDSLTGLLKLSMLRQCATFFYGVCPRPRSYEYREMSKILCDNYPSLKDETHVNGEYWVSNILCTYILIHITRIK